MKFLIVITTMLCGSLFVFFRVNNHQLFLIFFLLNTSEGRIVLRVSLFPCSLWKETVCFHQFCALWFLWVELKVRKKGVPKCSSHFLLLHAFKYSWTSKYIFHHFKLHYLILKGMSANKVQTKDKDKSKEERKEQLQWRYLRWWNIQLLIIWGSSFELNNIRH